MQPQYTPDEDIPLKRCIKCCEEKSATVEFFYKISQGKLANTCKKCTLARARTSYERNREKRLAYVSDYQKHNREKKRQWSKNWRKRHPEYLEKRRKQRPTVSPGHKHCPRCAQEKPATTAHFGICKRTKDGLQCWCKVCRKEHREQNIEQIKEANRRFRAENIEKIQGRRAERKEQERESERRYRLKNKERVKEKNRQWRKKNKEKAAEHDRRRRARSQGAEGEHRATDIKKQYKAQRGKCYYCGQKVGRNYHVDHVIPLSRGGSNSPENIVIACPFCNLSKKDKLPHEWPAGNRLL